MLCFHVDWLKRSMRSALALASICLLSACAFAPGMNFSADEPLNPTDPDSVPEVTPITLDFVRRNNDLMESQRPHLNVGVQELLRSPEPYLIGAGDVLSIVVWDHPELVLPTQTYNIGGTSIRLPTSGAGSTPQGYVVSADGYVQFPYAGALRVVQMTESQAQKLITQRLSRYLADPQVTVRINGFRSKRVYVDGQVRVPGVIPITDVPLSLVDAVNQAGGVLTTGDASQIVLTRDGKNYSINLPELLRNGIDPSRIVLNSGDLVKVVAREENKVFVVGEVTNPSTVTLRNGKLTLNEALGDAGGVNPGSSDPRHIYVIRYLQEREKPEVYHLDSKSPVSLALAENFQLQAKDVIYVDSAPIVRWNRFISNLLPGFNTVISGTRVVKQ